MVRILAHICFIISTLLTVHPAGRHAAAAASGESSDSLSEVSGIESGRSGTHIAGGLVIPVLPAVLSDR
jgi:hypothetical protein